MTFNSIPRKTLGPVTMPMATLNELPPQGRSPAPQRTSPQGQHLGQGQVWWIAILIWLIMVLPAQAALELRVMLEQGVRQLRVRTSAAAVVKNDQGQTLGQLPANSPVSAILNNGQISLQGQVQAQSVWVEPVGDGLVAIGDRWYRGRLRLVAQGNSLLAINFVDLEQYLYSVLGGEMYSSWPQEALKAQAVAARSFALFRRQRDGNDLFDVGNTQRWQVYEGVADESPATRMAVDATAGQVLTYNGQIIEALFHASSGGHTENVENVWSNSLPYLRGVPDFDQGTPVFQWSKAFTSDQLGSLISGVGNVRSLVPVNVSPTGRVMTMRVVGDRGTRVLTGNEIRSALGLRSTLFSVMPANVGGNKVGGGDLVFQISGRGFGHGLGMSQWGAYKMALQGYNYQQIVLHYYQGTTLARIQVSN